MIDNCDILAWWPLMVSDSAFMVSVRISAGMPLAIKVLHNFSKRPHCWIVIWQLLVTCVELEGETRVRTTYRTNNI